MSDPTAPVAPLAVRARFVATGLVIGLALGGVGAGWTWYQGSSALSALEAASTQRQAELETAIDLANGRAAVLRTRVAVAQASAHLALQNFGDADNALKAAMSTLGRVDTKSAGVTAPALKTASEALQAVHIDPAGDLAAQSAQLTVAATAVDKLIGS